MYGTTRTGLTPAPKRHHIIINKQKQIAGNDLLPKKFEAMPIALSLRPLSGLYNPFSSACSVLCNHPAPAEIKEVISKCKQTLTVDGKRIQHLRALLQDKFEHSSVNRFSGRRNGSQMIKYAGNSTQIPDDLLRRYIDRDSRTITPTPTINSSQTRTSGGGGGGGGSHLSNSRRCITPELGKNEAMKERKKLILDLRRTHSQETLYWRPSSDVSGTTIDDGGSSSLLDQNKKQLGKSTKKSQSTKNNSSNSKQRSKTNNNTIIITATIPEEDGAETANNNDKNILNTVSCINEQEIIDDGHNIRRGKRRKKNKSSSNSNNTTTNMSGVGHIIKTFYLSEDPETQVSAFDADSLNFSNRPSLQPTNLLNNCEQIKNEEERILLDGSFLTEEAFRTLRIDLNLDRIENTFERYLNRALREAYRFLPINNSNLSSTSTNNIPSLKKPPLNEDNKKRFIIDNRPVPCKFSRSSNRFDIPINLKLFDGMSVLHYLKNYVWISNHHKRFYKCIFVKYHQESNAENNCLLQSSTEKDNQEGKSLSAGVNIYLERIITFKKLQNALEEILGIESNADTISHIIKLVESSINSADEYDEDSYSETINFRCWCGIVALSERFVLNQKPVDPDDCCDELEKQDFESLTSRMETLKISDELKDVLEIIRSSHNLQTKI